MPKNVTRTVRLDYDLDKAIEQKAKEANMSVSHLVNRLIRKYIDYDLPGEKFGVGPVASILVNHLFAEIDKEKAFEMGRKSAHEFTAPFITYLFGEVTLESSITMFRRFAEYGGRYTFDTHFDGKHSVLVLRHNGGEKVSAFYSGIFQGLYGEILKLEPKVETTADICVVQLPTNK